METVPTYTHEDSGHDSELDVAEIAHFLLSTGDVEGALEADGHGHLGHVGGRNSSSLTVAQLPKKFDSKDRKRARNREWMRRARLQKRAQQSDTQTTVSALEMQRNKLMRERNLSEAAVQSLLQQRHDTHTKITKYRQLNSAYTRVEQTLGSLREENFTLREELRRRRVAASIMEELVRELRLSESIQSRDDQLDSHRDRSSSEFQWFNQIDSFYKTIQADSVLDLVRQSYAEIMQYVHVAESCLPSAHQVFGWNDRRFLEGSISNFMFDKAFGHKTASELSQKTWRMSIDAVRMKVLQPRSQRMKVLQQLNDNTLVVARQSYFPNEDVNLCTVYVLFRLATPDGGFVIGSRSIEPYEAAAIAPFQASGRYLFTKLVYTFQFRPWPGSTVDGSKSEAATLGCHVTFGGRVDNVRSNHAANCLMDAILAMLRWEAHCVAPLLSLSHA